MKETTNNHVARQTDRPSVYTNGTKVQTRQTRAVITEEQYTSTLSSIISRDYYPALPSLRRDAAILKKRAEGDISGAVAVRRAARRLAVHEEALAERETEDEAEAVLLRGGIRKRARPLDRETVEGFHNRVTSEDNAEFESVMARERRERGERMAVVFNAAGSGAKDAALLPADHGSILDDTPLMASDHFNAKVERTHAPGTTSDGKNISDYSSLFFTPQHYPASQSEATQHAPNGNVLDRSIDDSRFDGMPPPAPNYARQIKPAANPSKTMPQPQERRDITPRDQTAPEPSNRAQLVEYIAKAPSISSEKRIVPLNTRLPYQNESRLVASSNRETAASADTLGTGPVYETDATTDLDASPRPLGAERTARARLLKRDRNTYVTMTPLILPGRGGGGPAGRGDDESPIVTWGNVASTPLVIGGHDPTASACGTVASHDVRDGAPAGRTDRRSFALPGGDATGDAARVAGQTLAGRSRGCGEGGRKGVRRGRSKKSTGPQKARNATNISFSERTDSLTPAAKALLQKCTNNSIMRLPSSTRLMSSDMSARSSSALGSALRVSYTPKMSRHGSKLRSSANRKSTVQKATPLLSPKRANNGSLGLVMPEKHGRDVRRSVKRKSCDDLTGGLLKL